MGDDISDLLGPGGGVARLDGDRGRRNRLHYLAGTGRLVRILPRVFIDPAQRHHLPTLARAATMFDPDAVITGSAAAALSYWPELSAAQVTVAIASTRMSQHPFRFEHRIIPPELTLERNNVRLTTPALTALDLCTGSVGPEAIDKALQVRAVDVPDLFDALDRTARRPGNQLRRRLVEQVRTGGCSVLERTGHRVLLAGGMDEWVANRRLRINGVDTSPDVRFTRRKLIIEFDGFAFHSSPDALDRDREKSNLYALAGYVLLRVTWSMLQDPAHFLTLVRRALRAARPY